MSVVNAVTAEIGWWGTQSLRFARAVPRFLALCGIVLVASALADSYGLAYLVLGVLVGLGLWARLASRSYDRVVARPAWRRRKRRRVHRSWKSMMDGCGLSRRVSGTERVREGSGRVSTREVERLFVPRLARLRWESGDLVAFPALLNGQTVADFDAASDALRTAVGADRIRIVPNRAVTACRIVWSFGDPLDQPFDAATPVQIDRGVIEVSTAPVGRDSTGAAFGLPVGLHTFVAGATGSGKSSWMWGPLFALAPAIHTGLVEVHGIDLKGGMELRMGEKLFTRCATTAAEAVVLLEEAAEQMQTRAASLAGHVREHTPTRSAPLIVVLIDELSALTAYQTDRDLLKRGEAALALLLSQGRAPGVVVWAFTQDPRKEVTKLRNLFAQMIALRLQTADETRMVLGDGIVNLGAACHRISIDTPGVAYVVSEDGRPERVRAGHVTDTAIKDVASRFAAPHRRPITVPEPEPSSKAKRGGTSRASRKPDDSDDTSGTATQDGSAQQTPGGEAA